jgi:predicted nucleic acid-binding protein
VAAEERPPSPVIHLDTSVFVEALVPKTTSSRELRSLMAHGEPLGIAALALFEWLRGPRTNSELSTRALLFPDRVIVEFGPAEAEVAARLYRRVRRPRGREADLAIAACAIVHGARLWTLNPRDFRDLPGLALYRPPG